MGWLAGGAGGQGGVALVQDGTLLPSYLLPVQQLLLLAKGLGVAFGKAFVPAIRTLLAVAASTPAAPDRVPAEAGQGGVPSWAVGVEAKLLLLLLLAVQAFRRGRERGRGGDRHLPEEPEDAGEQLGPAAAPAAALLKASPTMMVVDVVVPLGLLDLGGPLSGRLMMTLLWLRTALVLGPRLGRPHRRHLVEGRLVRGLLVVVGRRHELQVCG